MLEGNWHTVFNIKFDLNTNLNYQDIPVIQIQF
jgi:hypothetical protein